MNASLHAKRRALHFGHLSRCHRPSRQYRAPSLHQFRFPASRCSAAHLQHHLIQRSALQFIQGSEPFPSIERADLYKQSLAFQVKR